MVQGTVREVKAEHTPTDTTAKERQGIQAINVKSCPICRKKCGTLFVVYCTFFIFVRKVIYLKKITADFAVSTMLIAEKNMNNWIETSGSPFVIVEQQYAHQWKGQENYNAICSVTDYLGKIYIDNHVLLVMGDEPMATRIVNKDGAILIIRWKYAPDYLTVEKLLENDIVNGIEPIEEVEVKWDSTELVLFDSLSPYCEASVKVFLSLQKTSCIIKTYLYQKDEVSLIIHSIQ